MKDPPPRVALRRRHGGNPSPPPSSRHAATRGSSRRSSRRCRGRWRRGASLGLSCLAGSGRSSVLACPPAPPALPPRFFHGEDPSSSLGHRPSAPSSPPDQRSRRLRPCSAPLWIPFPNPSPCRIPYGHQRLHFPPVA